MRELFQGQFEMYRNMTDKQWEEYRMKIYDAIVRQARESATREIAIRLYDEGMETGKISKVTDEPIDEIKHWIDWECEKRMTDRQS